MMLPKRIARMEGHGNSCGDTGAGTSLAQEFGQGWSGFDVPRIIPRDARGAKRLRMELVSMVEAGKVFFADGPWLPEFLDELAGVPDGVARHAICSC